jgi:hypothetical protein
MREKILELRNDFHMHNKTKMLLFISIATNDMVKYVSMYPEVWFLDCTYGEIGILDCAEKSPRKAGAFLAREDKRVGGTMDAAPSSARGVSEELAPVPRVAAAENADQVTPPADRGVLIALFLLAAEAATSRWVFLTLAMELMMGEEPIASEREEC